MTSIASRTYLLLLTAVLLAFRPGDSDLPSIDAPIFSFMATNNVPGISLAIIHNGHMVYCKGYGFADREDHSRMQPGSLFRIASLSKPITSITIMKLVQEGKLSLDQKVFGPEALLGTRYGRQPYRKYVTDITVRFLLQHLGGGWGNSGDDPMFTDTARTKDQLIGWTLDTLPLLHQPGTNYEYSNFGYCVLGRVIEKITGRDYEEYVRKEVLLPAGITDMQIGGNTLAQRKAAEVKYYGQDGEDPYVYNIRRMDAHGGWIASASDLVQLLAHVDGSAGGKAILTPAAIQLMTTAPAASPHYACGWGVDTAGNWYHAGSLPGTRTELRHSSNGYIYALLINTRSEDTAFNKGLSRLMSNLIHTPIPGIAPDSTVTGYQPSLFLDSGRIGKMQAAFPIIDSLYASYARKNHLPGLAYGIVAGGRLVHTGSYGYNDLEKKEPVTPKSVFRIASMTKSFTAMAILKLRDAGKLNLEDPVYKYIPQMTNIKPLTRDARAITIRDLLTHSAGFPEDNPWGDRQLQRTDKDLMDFISRGVSLSNTPGVAYEYSNLGFALLGHIVTVVSGEPFEKYIRENIFAPLSMTHTYWEYSDVDPSLLVRGYSWINQSWREEELLHSGAYGAMGGLLTSIEDFGQYMAFHLSAWPPRNDQDNGPLKRSSVREMHLSGEITNFNTQSRNWAGILCPKASSYNDGLAWSKDCTGKEQTGHSGGLPGFGTHWTILPQYGIGVVSFASLTYAATVNLNFQVVDTLIAIAGLQPMATTTSDMLRQRKEELIKLLPDWNNAQASGIFSENFFLDYSTDSLRKDAALAFKSAGKILRVGPMQPDNQLRGNFILEGEKADIVIRITLTPEYPALIQFYSIRTMQKK